MRSFIVLFILSAFLISCKSEQKKLTAQEIIDKSIETSGVDQISNSLLSFDFRDMKYVASRNNGEFRLSRIKETKDGTREDILSNNGFERLLNAHKIEVPDSMAVRYSESINSVHYFSVLPYGLNDGAVIKKLLEEKTIKGKDYYKVQITFRQEGGGIDYDDVFIYWISKENFNIDYLAYTFHVNGGGKRFREVRKEHLVKGVRFTDHNNYKPKDKDIELSTLDVAFEKGALIKASEINLENIELTFPED
ncbi:MAG: deoxyribose-phosphate aldolase [Flavobacteriaceae bacterium]